MDLLLCSCESLVTYGEDEVMWCGSGNPNQSAAVKPCRSSCLFSAVGNCCVFFFLSILLRTVSAKPIRFCFSVCNCNLIAALIIS